MKEREDWINEDSMDWVLFEYFEGNLSPEEMAKVQAKFDTDPEWKKAASAFELTYLEPEVLMYPNTSKLLKKDKVIGMWWGMPLFYKSAAAMLILAGSIWLYKTNNTAIQTPLAQNEGVDTKLDSHPQKPLISQDEPQNELSIPQKFSQPVLKSDPEVIEMNRKTIAHFQTESRLIHPEYAMISDRLAPAIGPDFLIENRRSFIESLAQTWKNGDLKNPKIRFNRKVHDHNPVWVLNFKTDNYEAQAAILIKTHKN